MSTESKTGLRRLETAGVTHESNESSGRKKLMHANWASWKYRKRCLNLRLCGVICSVEVLSCAEIRHRYFKPPTQQHHNARSSAAAAHRAVHSKHVRSSGSHSDSLLPATAKTKQPTRLQSFSQLCQMLHFLFFQKRSGTKSGRANVLHIFSARRGAAALPPRRPHGVRCCRCAEADASLL